MPADSDDEYVQTYSDDDVDAHQVSKGGSLRGKTSRSGGGSSKRAGGFEVSRTWETLEEGADGTISGAIEGLLEAGKRKRLTKDTTPLQRGIIRHIIVVIDLSEAMLEKDLRPTRHLLTIHYTQEFVRQYFEQNPISQLGIIGMRDGLAVRVSDMSGNPEEHIAALQALCDQEPKGSPSLQNALDMARGALYHAPSHGTREVLIIFGAIYTVDPGDINDTIKALVSAHIICTVIGLSAEVAICRTLVARTNPSLNPQAAYTVALDEQHYRELVLATTTPPPIAGPASTIEQASDDTNGTLLMMGFPSRVVTPYTSLCACHSQATRDGYLCPRCNSKACALPTECRVCGFTLILSTHLARSYHHLFPLRNWLEVMWSQVRAQHPKQRACFGCQTLFPEVPTEKALENEEAKKRKAAEQRLARLDAPAVGRSEQSGTKVVNEVKESMGISESGRYMCPSCETHFCIDCDLFSHQETHNCPSCLSKAAEAEVAMDEDIEVNGQILDLLVQSI